MSTYNKHNPEPVVKWDRDEEDPCEAGTPGCCVDHPNSPRDAGCETW